MELRPTVETVLDWYFDQIARPDATADDRVAAWSQAIEALDPSEREAIRLRWSFRRLARTWERDVARSGNWSSRTADGAMIPATRTEIRTLASFYRRESDAVALRPEYAAAMKGLQQDAVQRRVW